jgi:hypothetical protein
MAIAIKNPDWVQPGQGVDGEAIASPVQLQIELR